MDRDYHKVDLFQTKTFINLISFSSRGEKLFVFDLAEVCLFNYLAKLELNFEAMENIPV